MIRNIKKNNRNNRFFTNSKSGLNNLIAKAKQEIYFSTNNSIMDSIARKGQESAIATNTDFRDKIAEKSNNENALIKSIENIKVNVPASYNGIDDYLVADYVCKHKDIKNCKRYSLIENPTKAKNEMLSAWTDACAIDNGFVIHQFAESSKGSFYIMPVSEWQKYIDDFNPEILNLNDVDVSIFNFSKDVKKIGITFYFMFSNIDATFTNQNFLIRLLNSNKTNPTPDDTALITGMNYIQNGKNDMSKSAEFEVWINQPANDLKNHISKESTLGFAFALNNNLANISFRNIDITQSYFRIRRLI